MISVERILIYVAIHSNDACAGRRKENDDEIDYLNVRVHVTMSSRREDTIRVCSKHVNGK